MTPRLCQETTQRRVLTQQKITCFLAPTLEEEAVTIGETSNDVGGGYQLDNINQDEHGEHRDVGMVDGDGQQGMDNDDLSRQETPSVRGNTELNIEKAGGGSRDNLSENTIMMMNDD